MARTWLSVRVELIGGQSEHCWPRAGRVFGPASTHTFAALADAIDDAFARWDRAHLCQSSWPTAAASARRTPSGTKAACSTSAA